MNKAPFDYRRYRCTGCCCLPGLTTPLLRLKKLPAPIEAPTSVLSLKPLRLRPLKLLRLRKLLRLLKLPRLLKLLRPGSRSGPGCSVS